MDDDDGELLRRIEEMFRDNPAREACLVRLRAEGVDPARGLPPRERLGAAGMTASAAGVACGGTRRTRWRLFRLEKLAARYGWW